MTLELRPNEYVKIEVHFSYKVFVLPTLLMSIGILMFLAVWSGVGEGERFRFIGHIYSVAGIMMMIGGLLFIPYIYKRVDNKLKIYAVTNQRVYVRRGIINIKERIFLWPKSTTCRSYRVWCSVCSAPVTRSCRSATTKAA